MPDTLDLRHLIKQCSECGQRFSPSAIFCPFDGTPLIDAVRPPPKVDPLLGQTLDGRYAIETVLGEGGMGTVYGARHVTLGRSLALKVLRADLAAEPELSERFLQEAQATAAIKHPNVVSITDFGRLPDGRPYFVMELLAGRTLASLIKAGGAIPPRTAARVAIEIAGGLGAAHSAGVVHRDLKPENVFLVGPPGQETQELRVVDFGAAIVLGRSRLTKKGIVFGTPYYMSPEQAAGRDVDHRTDVYSLGIILYEMVTGRVPFEGETYMGVLTQHMFVAPKPPSQISMHLAHELGPLEAVILRALEKDPRARYATMQDLADAISAAVEQGATRGPSWPAPASPSQRPPRGIADELELPSLAELRGSVDRASQMPRRRKTTAVVIVAAAFVCAAIAAVALHARSSGVSTVTTATAATASTTAAATTAAVPKAATTTVSGTQSSMATDSAETPNVAPSHPIQRNPRPPTVRSSHSATVPGLGPDPFLAPH